MTNPHIAGGCKRPWLVLAAGLSFATEGTSQVTTLYESDFEPKTYQTGADMLVGADQWTGTNVGQEVHGIDTDIFLGWTGQTAFLGFNTPTFPPQTPRLVEVARPITHDVVSMPIVRFSMLLSIIDSEPIAENMIYLRDRFYVAFRNRDGRRLAAIDFDNTEAGFGIWTSDGVTESYTGADFIRDELLLLDVEINFAANTWSVSLGEDFPILEGARFTATQASLELGEIALLWVLVEGGDNWILFDDIVVAAFPEEAFKVGDVTVGEGGEVTLAWNGVPGYDYQVEYSDDFFESWRTDLPGSKKSVVGGPALLSFTDSAPPPSGVRYYRIVRTVQEEQQQQEQQQ